MIANFRLKSFIVAGMLVMVAMTLCAEDVVFMTNRRQWEKLPTTKVMDMAIDYTNVKNMPDSAMLCFSIVANRYNENLKSEDLKLTIRATCYVGFLYFKKYHNHQESYRYLLKAKDLAEKHKYNDFMPDILMHLGNLFNAQEGLQHDKSIKEALAYQPNNKIKLLYGVKTKRDGKQTQVICTNADLVLKNNASASDITKAEKDLTSAKNAGKYSSIDYRVQELAEYDVQPTNLETPSAKGSEDSGDMPWD